MTDLPKQMIEAACAAYHSDWPSVADDATGDYEARIWDMNRAITAALAAMWSDDMESAPKDGTVFIAFQKRDEVTIYECWWQEDIADWSGWQDYWDNEPEPTHWMPRGVFPLLTPKGQ